jgi:ankyrin repeat protein
MVMSGSITPRGSLESLRKEAKRWLKALRANVADARARLAKVFPDAPDVPTLRDVQHALALEHGLPGWSALRDAVTHRTPAHGAEIDWVARFFDVACPDHHVRGGPDHTRARHTAIRILEHFPFVATDSFYTAIVTGNLAEVARVLARHPAAAREKSGVASRDRSGVGGEGDWFKDIGPKGWEPLLYLAFTRLPLAATNDNAVAIARLLLDHGADPNVYFMAGDSRYTPLVGVIGEGEEDRPPHPRRDELARLFLERGANPYDDQVVYNIGFHGKVLWFLKLIYEFSVKAGRKADWDDPNWSMLNMGGYGSGAYWHLHIAVVNNDLDLAEWILTHGGSPNAIGPTDKRMIIRGTLLEEAQRHGLTNMTDLLLRHGAVPTTVTPEGVQAFVAAAMRRDRDEAERLLARHPEYRTSHEAMWIAAKRDRVEVAQFLLDLGVSPDVQNQQKERPLHIAAYNNSLRVARLLIDRGAEIDPVESNYGNTPLGAATYSQHPEMIALLGSRSRDIWELTVNGNVERLRELLGGNPELAKTAWRGHTLLMWLPDDDVRAMEITRMLLALGADPSPRNDEGLTAADRAERRGMLDIAALLRSKERPSTPPPPRSSSPTVAEAMQLVEDIVAGYTSGNAESLERIGRRFGRMVELSAFRTLIDEQLGEPEEGHDRVSHFPIVEARRLVARIYNFPSWDELAENLTKTT